MLGLLERKNSWRELGMAYEIEYRFLVEGSEWRAHVASAKQIEQGYLFAEKHGNARVRILDGVNAIFTVKGARSGPRRPEFEWEIALDEARSMIGEICGRPPIVKTRHQIGGLFAEWIVDEFFGENAGLIIAELEVETETETFLRPTWLGREVTDDERYSNANLQFRPFGTSS
jgi:adenylate cyclase